MTINVYPPYGAQSNPQYVAFDGNNVDAFGRLRISNPFTLFDAQSRFAADSSYSYATGTGGTTTYNTNKSSVNLNVTTSSGSTTVAQTFRVFPYQPGKSLLTLQTWTMAAAKANLRQRIGYFSAYNGVYFSQGETSSSALSFTIRTYTSGSVDNTRTVVQSNWNGDKLDGTGPSGVNLDVTKTQILWFDMEWLGVGNVRCGFIINGQYITCHTFQNSNFQTAVYMQTAILPLRYEIATTGATSGASTLQMICSTVVSEGGYEQISQPYVARNSGTGTSIASNTGLTFTPIVSIRVNSSYYGAIVIPSSISVLPSGINFNAEVVFIKNATLTGASWTTGALAGGQVDTDVSATACTATDNNIVQSDYIASGIQGKVDFTAPFGYNFDLQLGFAASLSGNGFASSDTYTVAMRGIGATGTGFGSLAFYNLTV
jgi:hypothetical protein